MGMYHPDHPDSWYQTANEIRELQPGRSICWATGTEDADGRLSFGGWTWRYDLTPAAGGGSHVRLTYDWSAATTQAREVIAFPPFGSERLKNSLRHLAALATSVQAGTPEPAGARWPREVMRRAGRCGNR